MRPIHWAKVPDIKASGTIWADEGMIDGEAGIDVDELENVFGLDQATRGRSASAEALAGGVASSKRKEQVQLVDVKRANNVSIALARLRLTDEAIREAILDPVAHELTSEQITALLGVVPTAEELETIRDYSGDRDTLGRVENFFLVLADIDRLGPRLQAIQATQQFAPQWETLMDECKTVVVAAEQVKSSPSLKQVLLRVLAMGNYLNGTSARGGAYGFKLQDLNKLVQVSRRRARDAD